MLLFVSRLVITLFAIVSVRYAAFHYGGANAVGTGFVAALGLLVIWTANDHTDNLREGDRESSVFVFFVGCTFVATPLLAVIVQFLLFHPRSIFQDTGRVASVEYDRGFRASYQSYGRGTVGQYWAPRLRRSPAYVVTIHLDKARANTILRQSSAMRLPFVHQAVAVTAQRLGYIPFYHPPPGVRLQTYRQLEVRKFFTEIF